MKAQPHTRRTAPRRKPLGRDRRRWRRVGTRPGPKALLAAIPSFPRPLLERTVQTMIDQLDQWDGDCDLEGGCDDEPEHDGAEQEYPMRPIYGLDQSTGPINEHEAMLALLEERR